MDEAGNWIKDREDIKDTILYNFKSINATEGEINFQPELDMIDPIITEEMNQMLKKAIEKCEVKAIVEELGALKGLCLMAFQEFSTTNIGKSSKKICFKLLTDYFQLLSCLRA